MARQAAVESELESIAGRRNVVRGKALETYAVDGLVPGVAVRPGSYAEVAEVLRYASSQRLAVLPRGGGTKIGMGNLPRGYDVALDLSRLDAIVEHEPADLTVTCQAGITIGALASALAPSRQLVPFDPALPETGTAGGTVASGASGPCRMTYGAPRDFTIGMRVVTADGRETRAGGKVVKNVAGYDLCKLYTGSRGTLGVIVETTFKVLPQAAAGRVMAIAFEEPADACAFAASVYRHNFSVRGISLRSIPPSALTPGSCVLTLDFSGTVGAVERSVSEIERLVAAENGITLLAGPPPPGELDLREIVFRIAARPTDVPSLIAGVSAASEAAAWEAFPVTGVVRAGFASATRRLIGEVDYVAARLSSPYIVETCPTALKRDIDVFGPEPPGIGIMRRVKTQFDPLGILSPGRFAGKI